MDKKQVEIKKMKTIAQ